MSAVVDADKTQSEQKYNTLQKDIKIVQKTLKKIDKAVYDCATKPGQYNLECSLAATNKIFRELPMVEDAVYPWSNFDFNYRNIVDKLEKDITVGASEKLKQDQLNYEKQQTADQKAFQEIDTSRIQTYYDDEPDPGLQDGPAGSKGTGGAAPFSPSSNVNGGIQLNQNQTGNLDVQYTKDGFNFNTGSYQDLKPTCSKDAISLELQHLLAEFDMLFTTPIPDMYTVASDPTADTTDLYVCPDGGYDINLGKEISMLETLIAQKTQEIPTLQDKLDEIHVSKWDHFWHDGHYKKAESLRKELNDQIANDTLFIEQANALKFKLQQQLGSSCEAVNEILVEQNISNSKLPYPDPFFTDERKPLTGKSSSSYFVKVGSCKMPQYKTREECETHQYNWKVSDQKKSSTKFDLGISFVPPEEYMSEEAIHKLKHPPKPTPPPGTCFKDRFAYINNRPESPLPGSPEFTGLIPSMVNDFIQISPDHVFQVAMGNNVPGIQTQVCPEIPSEVNENFTSQQPLTLENKLNTTNYRNLTIIILGCVVILYVAYLIMGS